MSQSFNKIALITGGASGMGLLMAQRLASAGTTVAIVDVNERALAEAARGSNRLVPYVCDVSDSAAVTALVEKVTLELGPIDRLVTAAALMPGQAIAETSVETINRIMAINYGGTVNFTKAVLPGMLARNSGEMVIFGSIAGVSFSQNLGPYCATKAAVNAYAEVLTHELADSGINFLLVCPPAVATPLITQAIEHGPGALRASAKKGSLAKPEMIINAIEAGLRGRKKIIFPGQANMIQWLRRISPALTWKITTAANAAK